MRLEADVLLAPRTSMKLGGRARFFASASSEDDIVEAHAFAERERLPLRVLGGGSNVVIADAGFDGLVLGIELRGRRAEPQSDGSLVRIGAGEPWDAFVDWAIAAELSGVECLSGIPGLVGATPIQNVGAYGQEVAGTITFVRAFDTRERSFVELDAPACDFGYRASRFKFRDADRFIVSEVEFRLRRAGPAPTSYPELARALALLARTPTLRDVRNVVLELRRSKSMLLEPGDANARSCGSFFVNPSVSPERADVVEQRFAQAPMPRFPQADGSVKLSAGWLIERSGFAKGLRRGNVGLSSRHALALVCHDGATSHELLALAEEVRAGVFERTGITLHPEPVIW